MAVPLFLRSQPISTERGGARAAVKRDGAVDSRESLLRRQRVYDPLLRLIHAWNAVCIVGLIASAELDFLAANVIGNEFRWQMHVWLGYGLTVGLVTRLVWGFTGPAHARWRDLWHPDEWAGALRSGRWLVSPRRFGHHPQASAAYLALYSVLVLMGITGLGLAALEQNMGPLTPWLDYRVIYQSLIKVPHALLSWVVLIYIPLHLLALVVHTKRDRVPMVQSMLTGYQYLRKES